MNKSSQFMKKEYEENIRGNLFSFTIEIDEEEFVPNADALLYVNKPNSAIALVKIDDYELIFQPAGDAVLYDEGECAYYKNKIPSHIYELIENKVDLSKYNIQIENNNWFELIIYKKTSEDSYEFYGSFDDVQYQLDSTYEQLIDYIYTKVLIFIENELADNEIYEYDESTFDLIISDEDIDECYFIDSV